MTPWFSTWQAYQSLGGTSDFREFKARARATALKTARGLTRSQAARLLGVRETDDEEAIRAAWKKKTLENHPDRGGSVEAMSQINVAAETLLEQGVASGRRTPEGPSRADDREKAKQERERRQRAEATPPPDPAGGTYASAVSKGSGISWKLISVPSYKSDPTTDGEGDGEERMMYWKVVRSWVLFGVDPGGRPALMGLIHRRHQRGMPSSSPKAYKDAWDSVVYPLKGNLAKVLPRNAKAFLEDNGSIRSRVKWGLLDGRVPSDPFKVSADFMTPKALEAIGFSTGRRSKPVVSISSKRKPNARDLIKKIREGGNNDWYNLFDFEVLVDGKGRTLSEREVNTLAETTPFMLGVYEYNYEKPKITLTRSRKYKPAGLLGMLLKALSPSPLKDAVQAAKDYYDGSSKTARNVARRYARSLR
jgi:hypothetical protein